MLLLDNSAWARFNDGALPTARRSELAEMVRTRMLATSLPFLLEAGYSARNHRDHQAMMAGLGQLPFLALTPAAEASALAAQAALAAQGHHRLPPIDLIQAALANEHGVGILHYDNDYAVIAERTQLTFQSVWLAPRGSL